MLSALRVLTTKAPQVADTARRVVTNHTQKQVALPFVRQYTMSMRHQPSTITTQIRHYSSSSTPPDDTGGGSGIQRTRGHSTAGTQGHPSPATPSSQGPGLLSIAVDALVNAVSALFGQTGTASPPLPTVAPERAKEVYAYLGDHSFKRPSAQPFQGDAQAAVRFHQQRASETATSLGVPKSVADQMPPEADLAMWMYQQAQTDGGSVDDNHVPPPFNGRDFNQALRGDAPLRTGESRPPRDTHDARDISREKLIAGLELRVLTPPPPTPSGEPKVYARTLATNDHNAELLRRLNAGEAVTDAGVISVTTKLDAASPAMYLVSVDNAFVDPHGPDANDLARAEAEHMAVGQVLVKIGEHNGVPIVAAHADMAVHANALADIARHFTFQEGTLETAVQTQARTERADAARTRIAEHPDELLALARGKLTA
ncbi:hypothetical protein [Achromobacter ruhlandii]|uniref:hypothetical protein n=1 Tax=Achromobacter ruhlandii TaxID=72557 RepID=UPI0022B88FDC|nr:hypothetical protein [Achromobacter ruhlandii]MCZ8398012.1 hypothetical protein [Achromobacter ruhlandii]